jgi:NADH-quinone oxidoreductase subunit J
MPLLVAGGLFMALYTLLVRANFTLLGQPAGWETTVRTVGIQLMTEYVVPFEIAGILLLAALAGATYLAALPTKPRAHAAR